MKYYQTDFVIIVQHSLRVNKDRNRLDLVSMEHMEHYR